MQGWKTALHSDEHTGQRITIPFESVNREVNFRTGQLAILAAAPGGGKSTVATNWAYKSEDPLLYLALEDDFEIKTRILAVAHLNVPLSDIQRSSKYYAKKMDDWRREELLIDPVAYTLLEIEQDILAMEEWLGVPPPVVFIDNVKDVKIEGFNRSDSTFYLEVFPELKALAKRRNVGIVALHHVRGRGEDRKEGRGNYPLKLNSLKYAGEEDARHVWGLYGDKEQNRLWFQILKQTSGPADPSGNHRIPLDWYPEMSLVQRANETHR